MQNRRVDVALPDCNQVFSLPLPCGTLPAIELIGCEGEGAFVKELDLKLQSIERDLAKISDAYQVVLRERVAAKIEAARQLVSEARQIIAARHERPPAEPNKKARRP